ncbi:Uncharacterised protein [Mycobacteroides abscessus subsp. abscessus]|nr:Uncharacterised protein [Mycobacteroides abscessus subsp. abscessus]
MADSVEVLISWLAALGDTRTERPNGAVLPFRTARRIGGGDDGLVDHGLHAIHTITQTEAQAHAEGVLTYRRVMALIGPHAGQQPVTLPDGQVFVDGGQVTNQTVIKWCDDGSEWAHVLVCRVDIRSEV